MKRVLIADDTNNIRMLLTACLQADGYEVVAAANGEAAQEILLNEPLDLAFIDVKMPLISGTQVLKTAREKGIMTPVIVMTAFATVKNAIDCTRYGAAAYLQKPFTANKVKSVIAELTDSLSEQKSDTPKHEPDSFPHASTEALKQSLFELLKLLPMQSENAGLYRKIGNIYKALGQEKRAERFFRCAEVFED